MHPVSHNVIKTHLCVRIYAFIHLLLLEYMKWLNIKDIKDLVLRIVYTVKILLIAMTAQENYAACINI